MSSLQDAVEIIREHCYLMVNGCQAVGFTDGVGDKAGVIDPFRHVSLITGQDENMIEIQVSCL